MNSHPTAASPATLDEADERVPDLRETGEPNAWRGGGLGFG